MPAITNGAAHWPDAESRAGVVTFGCFGPDLMPSGARAKGLARVARSSGSVRVSSTTLSRLATVPPLAPPFIAFTRIAIWVHGSPKRRSAACWVNQTPRSDGIESKPQVWTMRAPEASAVAEWASIMRCIHCGSPVRSQ